MGRLLRAVFGSLIRAGNLRVTTAGGSTFTFGDGTGRAVAVRFTTRAAQRGVLLDPELKFGEAYMDGSVVVEQGSIADVLAICSASAATGLPAWARSHGCALSPSAPQQFNPRRRARRNVAHHYDLDERLYSLFLDADRQYSCAYFETPDQSLDDAQLAKKRHLAAKLLVKPGRRVLDIGCGWGGLALYLAELCGARVTGITLSERAARARARARGREGPVRQGRVPPAGLSRRAGELRPHRLGRHVRACRRRLLRRLLPQVRRAARRRRRHAAAFDRPLGRPQRHQSVDREIHLPRRLYSGAVGGAAGDRARRPARHRHRDPAAALRRDAEGLARALPRASRGSRAGSTTRASCACGSSISRPPRCRSASRP